MPYGSQPPSYWGSVIPEHWTADTCFTWCFKDQELQGKTFSQCGQDLIVEQFCNSSNTRLFLDLGANNGIDLSSSFLLEKMGWTGLLVEPNLELIHTLTNNRKSDVLSAAVSPDNGITILSTSHMHTLGTLNSSSSYQVDRLVRETRGGIKAIRTQLTPTVTFSSLIKTFVKYYGYKPDFLKIDIEGMEEYVLACLCEGKILPDIIEVENNLRTNAWSQLMHNSVYKCCIVMDSFVEIWVRSNIAVTSNTALVAKVIENARVLK